MVVERDPNPRQRRPLYDNDNSTTIAQYHHARTIFTRVNLTTSFAIYFCSEANDFVGRQSSYRLPLNGGGDHTCCAKIRSDQYSRVTNRSQVGGWVGGLGLCR